MPFIVFLFTNYNEKSNCNASEQSYIFFLYHRKAPECNSSLNANDRGNRGKGVGTGIGGASLCCQKPVIPVCPLGSSIIRYGTTEKNLSSRSITKNSHVTFVYIISIELGQFVSLSLSLASFRSLFLSRSLRVFHFTIVSVRH